MGALTVMRHGALHRVDAAVAELRARQPGLPPLPTMLIQGADDEVVYPVNQLHLSRQARLLNGVPAATPVKLTRRLGSKRTLPYQVEDVLSGRKVMLRVATVERLKHAWSGGDARLSFNSGTGPDASKMLLQFFSRHRRLSIR